MFRQAIHDFVRQYTGELTQEETTKKVKILEINMSNVFTQIARLEGAIWYETKKRENQES